MNQVTQFSRDVFKKSALLLIIVLLTVLIVFEDKIGVTFGILFGTFVSWLNFYILSRTLTKAVKFAPSGAFLYTTSYYVLRYLITFLALLIALKIPAINFYTTALGLFIIKAALLLDTIITTK